MMRLRAFGCAARRRQTLVSVWHRFMPTVRRGGCLERPDARFVSREREPADGFVGFFLPAVGGRRRPVEAVVWRVADDADDLSSKEMERAESLSTHFPIFRAAGCADDGITARDRSSAYRSRVRCAGRSSEALGTTVRKAAPKTGPKIARRRRMISRPGDMNPCTVNVSANPEYAPGEGQRDGGSRRPAVSSRISGERAADPGSAGEAQEEGDRLW